MKLNYKGKTVLIIGGTSEMGLYLAELCIESGLYPILTSRDRSGKKRIEATLSGDKFETVFADLNDRSTISNLPDCDYLVDFSQSDYESLIVNSSDKEEEQYFTANLMYKSLMLKHVANSMKNRTFGRFVYVSSVAAERLNPGQGYYASVKSGVESLYRSAGIELGGLGITTAILRPGYVNAGRSKKYIEDHEIRVKKLIPIKRLIQKEEVCETIMFLLSDSALAINSTVLTIDGGQTALK